MLSENVSENNLVYGIIGWLVGAASVLALEAIFLWVKGAI